MFNKKYLNREQFKYQMSAESCEKPLLVIYKNPI